jgi:hypothetical protein
MARVPGRFLEQVQQKAAQPQRCIARVALAAILQVRPRRTVMTAVNLGCCGISSLMH